MYFLTVLRPYKVERGPIVSDFENPWIVLSGRKHCWSNDRERERERDTAERERESEICVCVGFERNCSWLSWIFIPF